MNFMGLNTKIVQSADPVWAGPELCVKGQPGRQLGGGVRHPDGRDADVRAGVPEEEDGGRGGSHGCKGGARDC